MTGPRIFISYRRSEFVDGVYRELSTGSAQLIEQRLTLEYGEDEVYRDVDDLGAGALFNDEIPEAIDACDVFLVVICDRWLDARDPDGNPRLDNPDDWVRREVEQALQRTGLLVVPVLVDGAKLPSRALLPESLRPLLARNAIFLRDENKSYDAAFKRITDAIGPPRLPEPPPDPPPPPSRRGIASYAPAMASAAVVLLLAAGLALTRLGGGSDQVAGGPAAATSPTSSTSTSTSTVRRNVMLGDFNIAVTEFTSADVADAATARAVATRFSDELKRAFPSDGTSPLVTAVSGPDETGGLPGLLPGAGADERSRAALDLAGDINATVVIVGHVDAAGFTAEATLSPQALTNYPELAGSWSFGTKPFSRDALVQKDRVGDLRDATAGVAHLMRGISYYQRIDLPGSAEQNREQARMAFEEALAAPTFPDQGKAVAHTFLGSLALLSPGLRDPQHPFEDARANFEAALLLDPTSSRARLGLAEVELQEGRGDGCTVGIDGNRLRDAVRDFDAVTPLDTDPPVTEIKAELGQARALRCLSQAGLGDDFDLVRTMLNDVIAAADGNPAFTEVAAAAHAELALTIAPAIGPHPDRTALEAALNASLDETLKAIDKTQRDQNEAVFLWQKAFYLKQLDDLKQTGDTHDAEEALAAAAMLDPMFSSARVGSLRPPATGRFVPWSGGGPSSPTVAVLAMTGDEVLRQFPLALGLLGAGFLLTSIAKRRRLSC